MNEEQPRTVKAYKRAALGLAAAAVLWTISFLLVQRNEGEQSGLQNWLVPIGAAALGGYFYLLSRNAKN